MADAAVERRVAEILARMDLHDKLRQMRMFSTLQFLEGGRFSPAKARELLAGRGIGAVEYRDIPASACPGFYSDLQAFLRKETRLGIPALVTAETLHGAMIPGATVFPQAIALASSWDADLVAEVASAAAREASALGVVQALAPDLDLAREPRWGRVEETYGEDPFLCTRLGVSYVRGLQGGAGSRIDDSHLVATLKHFAAHGSPEGGVNLSPVACGERQLRELYLPPFRAAVREAGALSVMPAYSELDGIPCSRSRRLLTDILREEWGFEGYTFSDYGAVGMLYSFHRTASGPAEAGIQALEAGMDLEAPVPQCYGELERLVGNGSVPMRLIDQAVARILRVKIRAGLFDGRAASSERALEIVSSPAHRDLARRVARESIVLLRNEGSLLPLPRDVSSLAVIGPNAEVAQLGDYAMDKAGAVGPLAGIRAAVSARTTVAYAKGCGLFDRDRSGIDEAVRIARAATVVVLCLGEASMTNFGVGWGDAAGRAALCGEGFDRDDIGLPGIQEELAYAVLAAGTPTIIVLANGRPLTVGSVGGRAAAVIETWYPGEQGGNALADILFGAANPCGKLPISFPESVGQSPVYYNHKPSARGYYKQPGSPEKPGRDYVFADTAPLYPFGYGLSYTEFAYSDLRISPSTIRTDGSVTVGVHLKNSGKRAGKEVVQLYVRDLVSSVTTPVKALKGFSKVHLDPGEERELSFALGPAELALVDERMREIVEPGEFEVTVGGLTGRFRVEQSAGPPTVATLPAPA